MTDPTTPKKNKKYTSRSRYEYQGPLLQSPYFSPPKTLRQTLRPSDAAQSCSESISDGLKLNTTGSIQVTENISYDVQSLSNRDALPSLPELILRLEALKPVLIQERVADDPWKLLVAVTLLNKTAGRLAIPTFWNIMAKWPTPSNLSQATVIVANEEDLIPIIRHLGTQNIRAKRLVAISRSYIQEPPSVYDFRNSNKASPPRRSRFFASSSTARRYPATPISHLPGTGSYALDSYRIFSAVHDYPGSEEWKTVLPADKELIRYLKWKWAFSEGMEWSPTKGVIGKVTEKYLSALIVALENNNGL